MSIAMEILEGLWNIKLNYKGIPTRALFISVPWENRGSYKSTLYQLRRKGLVDKKEGNWLITPLGKNYFSIQTKSPIKTLPRFDSPFNKSSPKNLLLIFDVPEERKSERQWLRFHLKKFGYFMIQKSVWVGPSPLPSKFISYLKEIELHKCIKTFKLAKSYPMK